jgi:GntR family transcriptional regulator, galactonate operon transcriptional repressor
MSETVVRGVHGQIVQLMARRILSGQVAEGHTIDPASLQRELGVSLTAVREALKVLTAKGLVDARQKRGTFVRPRSDWHLLDRDVIRWQFDTDADPRLLEELHEVRGIIEPAAARLAAERASDEDLAALDVALEAMANAADPLAAVDADLSFHRALLGATSNELLTKMEVFMETGLADRDRLVHLAKPSDDPVPSHRKVVERIRARDPRGAERAMQRLLDKARKDLSEVRGS